MQTAEPNLVAGMKWLQNTSTRPFNLRPRLWGGCSEHHGSRGIDAPALEIGALAKPQGSDATKLEIARVTRQPTTMSLSWLAEHPSIGSAANASQQIRQKPKVAKGAPRGLKTWMNLNRQFLPHRKAGGLPNLRTLKGSKNVAGG